MIFNVSLTVPKVPEVSGLEVQVAALVIHHAANQGVEVLVIVVVVRDLHLVNPRAQNRMQVEVLRPVNLEANPEVILVPDLRVVDLKADQHAVEVDPVPEVTHLGKVGLLPSLEARRRENARCCQIQTQIVVQRQKT